MAWRGSFAVGYVDLSFSQSQVSSAASLGVLKLAPSTMSRRRKLILAMWLLSAAGFPFDCLTSPGSTVDDAGLTIPSSFYSLFQDILPF